MWICFSSSAERWKTWRKKCRKELSSLFSYAGFHWSTWNLKQSTSAISTISSKFSLKISVKTTKQRNFWKLRQWISYSKNLTWKMNRSSQYCSFKPFRLLTSKGILICSQLLSPSTKIRSSEIFVGILFMKKPQRRKMTFNFSLKWKMKLISVQTFNRLSETMHSGFTEETSLP